MNLAMRTDFKPFSKQTHGSARHESLALLLWLALIAATIPLHASLVSDTTGTSASYIYLNNTNKAFLPEPGPASEIVARYAGSEINFEIYRNDKRVGQHQVRFKIDGNSLTVVIESSIRITILKIPVFTFRYRATEIWQEDQLVSASASTVENKKRSTVSLQNEGKHSRLSTLNGPEKVELLNQASNHWNANVLRESRFFNTLTGEAMDVVIESLGEQSIRTSSGQIMAQHYRYLGEALPDVWYDSDGRWVGLAFEADDGSKIRYQLIEQPIE